MIDYLLLVLAGALVCNAMPHLAAGLRGEPFPTPFAKPSGVGDSSPVINVLWGCLGLFVGIALLVSRLPRVDLTLGLAGAAVGFTAIGVFCARHFGKVRRAKHPG